MTAFSRVPALPFARALVLLSTLGCRDIAQPSRPTSGAGAAASSATMAARAETTLRHARVRASHSLGVPLHPQPESSRVESRLADGAEVTMLESAAGGRWVRVRAGDGREGWLVRRYLGETPAGASASAALARSAGTEEVRPSPWGSREACASAMKQGRPGRRPGRVRIGSWNVRWFPDGGPGRDAPRSEGTDIAWLGCAIAWLDLDVLAVQEFKTHPRAQALLAELLREVERWQGRAWRAEFDPCENTLGQHVGILYDSGRVQARGWHTYASLNPHGAACRDQLRPGFGAYLKFPGGLDLHLVSVHGKSGTQRRDFELRERSARGLAMAEEEAGQLDADPDLVFAGDFNTMGCGRCSPSVSPTAELVRLNDIAQGLRQPLRVVQPDKQCSEYSSGGHGLLDHFLISRSLAEQNPRERATVSGWCEVDRCTTERRAPVLERLSDHCPLVVELYDRDVD